MNLLQQIDDLRLAILAFYQSDDVLAGLGGTSSAHLEAVIKAIESPLALNTDHEPHQVPATAFWPQLLNKADERFSTITTAADKVFDQLHWKINKNYIGIFSDRFFDNESFVEVIGPNGLLIADTCRVGFLILGEDIYYPSHNHEATELYHTISGTGAWWQDGPTGGEEVLKAPGSAIYHEEWENHAMRTTEPLLNLWSWTGAIGAEAQAS